MVLGEGGWPLQMKMLPPPRPSVAEEGCLPALLFVSGAALSLIRRRILAPFLPLTTVPFKWGRPGGCVYPVLFLAALRSIEREAEFILFRGRSVVPAWERRPSLQNGVWCPEPLGKYFGKLDSAGFRAHGLGGGCFSGTRGLNLDSAHTTPRIPASSGPPAPGNP